MYYQATVLKTISETTKINASFLFPAEELDTIKNFLQTNKIIVLSLNNYPGTQDQFGHLIVQTQYLNKNITVISNETDIGKAVQLFFGLGFEVTNIVDTTKPTDPTFITQLIQGVKQQLASQHKETQTNKDEAENAKKKMYEDPRYQKLQEIISQTFDDVEDLLHRVQGAVSVASLKRLNDTIEEIKKLRMGTNTEKITQLLEEMFEAMEKIEVEFLDFQKQNDFKLLKTSFVSNSDVFGEVNKYKKAVKVKEAGTPQTLSDSYYIFFGKLGIYQTFLTKDFVNKVQQLGDFLSQLFGALEILVIMILIEIMVAIVLIEKIFLTPTREGVYETLIHFGIMGMILMLLKPFRREQTPIMIFLFIVAIFGYFYALSIVKINFAL